MKKSLRLLLPTVLLFQACKKMDLPCTVNEEASTFTAPPSAKKGPQKLQLLIPLQKSFSW
jgi:hypothetical protein